jgi:hypothetical protein
MTIFNEAVRMFFAVSALVLVGLLSAPLGGSEIKGAEVVTKVIETPATPRAPAAKAKNAVKVADRKGSRKIILKKG